MNSESFAERINSFGPGPEEMAIIKSIAETAKRIRNNFIKLFNATLIAVEAKLEQIMDWFRAGWELSSTSSRVTHRKKVKAFKNWYPEGKHIHFMAKHQPVYDKRKSLSHITRHRRH